ncbi:MAG: hypothetical protein OXB88_02880 [Bacteriovoracales bacterium]|nr:hypothetical protein [Bacteriovoracales bacterium]
MLKATAFFVALALSFNGGGLLAQEDFEVFDSEQVDVDGLYNRPKPAPTAADRTRERIKDLKKRINNKVDDTVENMRLKQEEQMGRRLENMFTGKGLNDRPQQAASVKKAPVAKDEGLEEISLYIWAGQSDLSVSNSSGFSNRRHSSNGSFRLEVSGELSPRVDIGVALGYNALSFDENPYSFDRLSFGYSERGISGDILSADLRGRFYLMKRKGKVHPFVSGFMGFSRLNLDYDRGRNPYGWLPYNSYSLYDRYGNETWSSSFMSAGIGVGLKMDFSKTFGLMAHGEFAQNFGRNKDHGDFRQMAFGHHYINEQMVLEDLSSQIEGGSQVNVFLGMRLAF